MAILGDVGGMYGSLYSIGWLFVGFFSHRLFIASILKHVYQVKSTLLDKEKNVNSRKLRFDHKYEKNNN